MPPNLSIIIATKNSASVIKPLIASINSQSYSSFEVIVIDGESSDSTPQLARNIRNSTIINHAPKGVYNAINKGLDYASGEWIYIIGADDRLASNAVLKSFDGISKLNNLDIIGGDVISNFPRRIHTSKLSFKSLLINTLHGQGCFYRRSIFNSFRFREDLIALSDYELTLLCFMTKKRFKRLPMLVAICGNRGLSNSLPLMIQFSEVCSIRWRFSDGFSVRVMAILLNILTYFNTLRHLLLIRRGCDND